MTNEPKITLKIKVDNILQMISNKVTSWSNTPSDDNYPSEKLVKDSIDNKASTTDLTNGLMNIGGYTIHTVYNVNGTTSAYDISSGLSYAQQTPVFFLVKNNIGDNEANATLKYYPNGNNIPIIDALSSNSQIQQGVWKKDTWALFFCAGNSNVQLRCIFYDSVDINEIKNSISNILRIEILPYYVVSSVSKDKRVTYNVDVNDYAIFNGNSFYLKVPYYETSTDKKITLKSSSAFIMQGSNYVIESQVNGHLLKLRYNNVFELLEIYNNDKLIPLFSDLSTVATSGSYNDLSNKPTIPSASSTTPSADTTSGSVGTGTTWARSNHTHPKSSLYAEATHTHNSIFPVYEIDDIDEYEVHYAGGHLHYNGSLSEAIYYTDNVNEIGDIDKELAVKGDLPTIIDNLTTNDATKVLSAKQGKVLNDLIGDAITYINGTGGS